MQLQSKAATAGVSTGCAAEKLHLACLRNLLGVRQGDPSLVTLAETGERPLWARWLLRAARLWNRLQALLASAALAMAPGSRQPARQPLAQWQQA